MGFFFGRDRSARTSSFLLSLPSLSVSNCWNTLAPHSATVFSSSALGSGAGSAVSSSIFATAASSAPLFSPPSKAPRVFAFVAPTSVLGDGAGATGSGVAAGGGAGAGAGAGRSTTVGGLAAVGAGGAAAVDAPLRWHHATHDLCYSQQRGKVEGLSRLDTHQPMPQLHRFAPWIAQLSHSKQAACTPTPRAARAPLRCARRAPL